MAPEPLSLEAYTLAAQQFEQTDRLVSKICCAGQMTPEEREWALPLVLLRKKLLNKLLALAAEAAAHKGDLT